jgi:hypothetical protein
LQNPPSKLRIIIIQQGKFKIIVFIPTMIVTKDNRCQ